MKSLVAQYLSRTISLPSLQLTSKPSLWKKGNHKRRDRSKKRNQCSEASNNLWVENRQRVGHEVPCVVVRPLLLKWGLGWEMLGDISYHKANLQSEGKHSIHSDNVRPQPLVSGSTLPSQVRTGSTAIKVPIVDGARHTLGVHSENIQQPRMHSSIPGSSQVRTGCTASNVSLASLPSAGGPMVHPFRHLRKMRTWTTLFPEILEPKISQILILEAWWTKTAVFASPEGTRNTHTPNIP